MRWDELQAKMDELNRLHCANLRAQAGIAQAHRLAGNESWHVHCMITGTGHVIGYTGKFLEKGRKRVHLGYAMGCVKGEDTELLPLGTSAQLIDAVIATGRLTVTDFQRGETT